jgi:hypothetical protein
MWATAVSTHHGLLAPLFLELLCVFCLFADELGQSFFFERKIIVTGKERGDLEVKDYVVSDRLPPPRTLTLDFTLTHA